MAGVSYRNFILDALLVFLKLPSITKFQKCYKYIRKILVFFIPSTKKTNFAKSDDVESDYLKGLREEEKF